MIALEWSRELWCSINKICHILVQRLGVLLEVVICHVRHLRVKEIVSPKFSGLTHDYPP